MACPSSMASERKPPELTPSTTFDNISSAVGLLRSSERTTSWILEEYRISKLLAQVRRDARRVTDALQRDATVPVKPRAPRLSMGRGGTWKNVFLPIFEARQRLSLCADRARSGYVGT